MADSASHQRMSRRNSGFGQQREAVDLPPPKNKSRPSRRSSDRASPRRPSPRAKNGKSAQEMALQTKRFLEDAFEEICNEVVGSSPYDDDHANQWRESIVTKSNQVIENITGDHKVFLTVAVMRRVGYVKSHSYLATEEDVVAKYEHVGEKTVCFVDCVLATVEDD